MDFIKGSYIMIPNGGKINTLDVYSKSIYVSICTRIDNNGSCDPSYDELAGENNCSRRKVIDSIKFLESLGMIKKTLRRIDKNENDTNIYEVMLTETKNPNIDDEGYLIESEGGSAGDALVQEMHGNNNNIYSNNIHIKNNTTVTSKPIREKKIKTIETFSQPTREQIYSFIGEKKGTEKFADILEDCKIEQNITIEQAKEIYEWIVEFFKEKYPKTIFVDRDGIFQGGQTIINELDKFIAHYSENQLEIRNLKARLRKWITNSLSFNQKK